MQRAQHQHVMLILLLFLLGSSSAWFETSSWRTAELDAHYLQQWNGPYFDVSASRNVTVREGETAYLTCRVENLIKHSVSWMRHHDLHILTINQITFISDNRFEVQHSRTTGDWTLRIHRTDRKDTGVYECQISTMPVKSLQLYLIVRGEEELVRRQDDILYDIPPSSAEPNGMRTEDAYGRMYADRVNDYVFLAVTTQILEGSIVYGYKGQNLNITCIVNHNYDRRPNHIIWYHKNDIVAYESLRKRERSPLNSITSYHLIRDAEFDDAGNYTCAPELYSTASTIVRILDGEEAQELNGGLRLNGTTFCFLVLLVSLCILYNHRDRMS
ncbi:zwei Ig domain protein zig-8-like isoform X1 [Anopheles bellator]|uniref:zwei Ig domain protein zig-8-like isoform X1 n=1 Tax=Anopheles bellator TaxID=139047 RepID=UPI0026493D2F|nr:zwei Ig domain protein zig-8-like isoform X1 [Anopheles bellator]